MKTTYEIGREVYKMRCSYPKRGPKGTSWVADAAKIYDCSPNTIYRYLRDYKNQVTDVLPMQYMGKNGFKHRSNGYIYFLLQRQTMHIKIGFQVRKEGRRYRAKHSMNPFELEMLAIIPAKQGIKAEKMLHQMFSSYHFRAEWFRYEPQLAKMIDDLTARAIIDINQLPVSGLFP